jgi:ribose transport system ATP-binding protein
MLLCARGLHKSFPGVRALQGVDFDVRGGEVHGLVGENAAGKSTLVKVITGAQDPDGGVIEAFGQEIRHGDPRSRQRSGIAAIYQEPAIVPELSAAANVFLGRPYRRGPFVSRAQSNRSFRHLSTLLGVAIDPSTRAGSLSVANQQMLEIMRALAADHRILIMDEPTSSLGPAERERLYEMVRGLRAQGVATVYVSHQLDEVLALCDRISVMREGELVSSRPVERWTKDGLVKAMLGRVLVKPLPPRRTITEDDALRVDGLTVPGVVEGVSFTLRRGEILGLGGLVGSGRTSILRALAGASPGVEGRLFVRGHEHPWPRSVRAALGQGIALVPEERMSQGLVATLSAGENVCLTNMRAVASGPVLRERRRSQFAGATMRPLGFDVSRLREPARSLSGGSQQKLVVGKWLHRRPDVLLLDEFTRGIDVGARAEMLAVVGELAAHGMSIIVVSSELDELVAGADRILALSRGRLVGELDHAEASVERLLRLIFEVSAEREFAT